MEKVWFSIYQPKPISNKIQQQWQLQININNKQEYRKIINSEYTSGQQILTQVDKPTKFQPSYKGPYNNNK